MIAFLLFDIDISLNDSSTFPNNHLVYVRYWFYPFMFLMFLNNLLVINLIWFYSFNFNNI